MPETLLNERSEKVTNYLQAMRDKGYCFVLESKEHLLFVKSEPPPLSDNGYFAGAVITAWSARQIFAHGLSYGLPPRYADKGSDTIEHTST